MRYSIRRDDTGATGEASYQEIEMIEAASPRWQSASDLPDGVEFDRLQFGGVTFTVYRQEA